MFVDADTWFEPAFVSSAVSCAERESLDVLTAFLRQQRHTWAERALLPYAFALYFCGVSARNVNSPDSPEALANGQCMLVRRSAYEALGGHRAVDTSVIEDVAFARLAKSRGFRVRVMRAETLGSVRMYDSFRAIRRGFEKNSFRFLQVNPLTGAQVIAASIVFTSWLPALWIAAAFGPPLLAVAVFVELIALLAPWYENADVLLAPVGVYSFQAIALGGMWKTLTGRTTDWKGRRV